MTEVLREVVDLRFRSAGRLTPNEYFYYRLWESRIGRDDKRAFVGKQAQNPMHFACNEVAWYATAADKLLFHTLLAGAGMPRPALLAVTQGSRMVPDGQVLGGEGAVAAFLRDSANYPLFGKPIDGKYGLAVINAEGYDAACDRVLLQGAEPASPEVLARNMASRGAGYLLQRRLASHPAVTALFGPRLWSVRVLMLVTPSGPLIHRAVAKIATGHNPADNFWRPGNMLGAVDLATGRVSRVVQGTGVEMTVNGVHPDTQRPIVGTPIPDWGRLVSLVTEAARLLPGIRTQSWDIALSEDGPVPLR